MKCKKNDCFSCPYPDCINNYVKPRYELSMEQKEKDRIRAAERYRTRRDSGVCVICGNRPAAQGKTKCVECNIWFNRYKRDWCHTSGTLPRSAMDGVAICKHCGKRQPLEGHKVCESCYSALLAALNEANRKRRRRRDG